MKKINLTILCLTAISLVDVFATKGFHTGELWVFYGIYKLLTVRLES